MKRKKIKSKTKLSEMYSKYGAGALRDRANKSGHKYWTFCDQCDSETPALRDMSCLMCGSTSDRGLRRNAGSKTNCDIITSTDWEDKENTLVYEKSLSPVCVGQKVRSRENYIVSGGRAPHKASSSGRVYVRTIGKGDPRLRMGREFFPHVFNMKWIPSYNLYPMDKVSGKARLKINRNSARANEIITKDHEYYDDVYYVWRPVPSFWIGDFVGSHSHKIGLFTKSKDSALRKNSTHERGMVNPDLSTRERDQDFSPLKKLVMDLASDFAPVVKDIESTRYSTTQNNYGRYMSLISSMSKGDKKRAEIIAMALITAGANRSGVKSALRVMFGE